MQSFSKHNCVIVFLMLVLITRPISYDEVKQRKLARLNKHHIEVINGRSQSVGQPFLFNSKSSTINDSLNSYSQDEYDYLMGHGNDLILVFRGKAVSEPDLEIDNETKRFNLTLRIAKIDSTNPAEELDVRVSMPEDRVLAKLYQIKPFGVNVSKEVDLKFARKLPTKPRLEYLNDKVGVKTIQQVYTVFTKYLKDDDTEVFFGKFGEKYDTENSDVEVYEGLYALNRKTKNMMFFRKQDTGMPYQLHAYMKLIPKKAKQLYKDRELLN